MDIEIPSDNFQEYPVLNSLNRYLETHSPLSEIERFSRNNYSLHLFEGMEDNKSEVDAFGKRDINNLVLYFKAFRIKRIAEFDSLMMMNIIKEKEFHAKEKKGQFQKNNFIEWYNKNVIGQIDEHCISLFIIIREIFSIHLTDELAKEISSEVLFDNWYNVFSSKKIKKVAADPLIENDALSLIDPAIKVLFEKIDNEILLKEGEFKSQIRCAAFCEILYEKKYITNTKNRRVTIAKFAAAKYKLDISGSLESARRADRDRHKNSRVGSKSSLRGYFK